MDKQALLFIGIFVIGNAIALCYSPFFGLLTYIHVYYNIPTHQYWANQVPTLRWSFICAIVLGISCFLHKDKLSKKISYKTFYILVGYFVLVIISSFLSPFPATSFAKIYEFLRYLIIFYLIMIIIRTIKQYQYVILLIILETFNVCLLGRHRFGGGRLDNVGIVDASSANQWAGLVVIVLCLTFSVFLCGNNYIKLICIITAPFVLDVFMMCGSRGAFLGLFLSGLYILSWGLKDKNLRWKIVGCSILGIIGINVLMGSEYKERLFAPTEEDELDLAEVSVGRTEIWKIGLIMLKDYPFGAGGGSFILLSRQYMPEGMLEKNVGYRASHSTYILTLVEQGYLGLFMYLSYLALSIQMLRSSMNKIASKKESIKIIPQELTHLSIYCLGLISAILSIAVTSVFADRLYYEMLYIVGALAACLAQIANNHLDQLGAISLPSATTSGGVIGKMKPINGV